MEAISRFIPSFLKKKGTGKFLKAVFKKSLVLMTVLAVIFSSFAPLLAPKAQAAAPKILMVQYVSPTVFQVRFDQLMNEATIVAGSFTLTTGATGDNSAITGVSSATVDGVTVATVTASGAKISPSFADFVKVASGAEANAPANGGAEKNSDGNNIGLIMPQGQIAISEVRISGGVGNTKNEFIELYNRTASAIDIDGYKLRFADAAGAETDLVLDLDGSHASTDIPASGYYLIANAAYTGISPAADITYANTNDISENGTILLYDNLNRVIDMVGFGTNSAGPSVLREGQQATMGAELASGNSIERKASSASTAATLAAGGGEVGKGNSYDTNNNNFDFVSQSVPVPQSSLSAAETATFTNQPPGINHMPVSQVVSGQLAEVYANMADPETTASNLVANLVYSTDGGSIWKTPLVGQYMAGQPFKFTIPSADTGSGTGTAFKYYLKATDDNATPASACMWATGTGACGASDATAKAGAFTVASVSNSGWSNSIKGRAMSGASGVNNVLITLRGAGLTFTTNTATDGADSGAFTFSSIPSGLFRIEASAPGYLDSWIDGAFSKASGAAYADWTINLTAGSGGGQGGDISAPMVMWSAPMDGMMSAPAKINIPATGMFEAPIMIGFTKDMDSATIIGDNIKIYPVTAAGLGTALTGISVAYQSQNGSVTLADRSNRVIGPTDFGPDKKALVYSATPLTANSQYAIVLSSGVKDSAGNALQGNKPGGGHSITFSTGGDYSNQTSNEMGTNFTTFMTGGGGGQFTPPYATGSTPGPGSKNVPTNAKIVVNFSQPMDTTGINASNGAGTYVKLYDTNYNNSGSGQYITLGSIVLDNNTKQSAVITVGGTGLVANHNYAIRVLGGAKSATGMPMAMPDQALSTMFQADFTTGTGADDGAPAVLGTTLQMYSAVSPACSTHTLCVTGVPTNLGVMEVSFSKDMDSSTITNSNITLKSGSSTVTTTVQYDPMSRSAKIVPSTALYTVTNYVLTLGTGVKAMNNAPLASAYTVSFTTSSTVDGASPTVQFSNADDYKLAITFSEPMQAAKATDTNSWAASVLNPTNYVLYTDNGPPPSGSTALYFANANLSTATAAESGGPLSFKYDAAYNTVVIEGLKLMGGAVKGGFRVWVKNVKDISGNLIQDSSKPANAADFGANSSGGPVMNSKDTFGMIGPGGGGMSGPPPTGVLSGGAMTVTAFGGKNPSMMGFKPIGVWPMNMLAGQESLYMIDIPLTQAIPASGQIIFTFPVGFDVTSAADADPNKLWAHKDINGPGTGEVVISGIAANQTARTITVTLGAVATQANDFLHLEIDKIKNTTTATDADITSGVSMGSGYQVDIYTKTPSSAGSRTLETLKSMPFFIKKAGSSTLTGSITFKDSSANNANVSITDLPIFLMSPMTGPLKATVSLSGAATANYTFSGIPAGNYMLGTDPLVSISGTNAGDYYANLSPMPQQIDIVSGENTKNIIFQSQSTTTKPQLTVYVTGTFTNEKVDIFAGGPAGFAVKTVTLNGTFTNASPSTQAIYLPNTGSWTVGIGPAMPRGPQQAGPPPMPNWMPPKPINVNVSGSGPGWTWQDDDGAATGDASAIDGKITVGVASANRTIAGHVYAPTGTTGIQNAQVFAYSPMGGSESHAETAADGSFSLKVADGSYKVGAFLPGMPPAQEIAVEVKTVDSTTTVYANGVASADVIIRTNNPESMYTISGKVTDGTNVIKDASIYARRTDAPGNIGTKTDSMGKYILYVQNGTWAVGGFLPQYGNLTEQTVTISSASQANIDFTPPVGTTFYTVKDRVYKDVDSGGAYDGGDTLLSGVHVEYTKTGYRNEAISQAGEYSIKVPAGTYTVTAWSPDVGKIAPQTVVVAANVDKNGSADLPVADTKTVTVNFKDGLGAAVSLDKVYVQMDKIGAKDISNEVSREKVSSLTFDIPAGANYQYAVDIDIPGVSDSALTIASPTGGAITANDVDGDSTTDIYQAKVENNITLNVTVPNLYTVQGSVKDGSNNPLPNTIVNIKKAGSDIAAAIKTDSSGNYSVQLPASGSSPYLFQIDKNGYVDTALSVAVVAPVTQNLDAAKSTANISGQIKIGASGAEGAKVYAKELGGGFASTETDTQGNYTLSVTPGDWKISAASDYYQEKEYQDSGKDIVVSASAAAPKTGVDITLTAQKAGLAGLNNADVNPSAGATFSDSSANLEIFAAQNAIAASQATYQIEDSEVANVASTPTSKTIGGEAVEIKAYEPSGSSMVAKNTFNDDVTIEKEYTKAELVAEGIDTFAETERVKMSYFDDSASNWEPVPTNITYLDATDKPVIPTANLSNVSAVLYAGTSDHMTVYSPTNQSPDGLAPKAPTGASASAGSNQVSLSWSVPSKNADDSNMTDLLGYEIYRATSSAGTYTQINGSDVLTNSYTDSTAVNGTTYYYKITAADTGGIESAMSSVVSATPVAASRPASSTYTPPADTTPPTNTSIVIAAGATATASASVTLTLAATDSTQMMISNNSSFTGSDWEVYTASKSWTLTAGDGTKTVYAKFRDASGNISTPVSDSITLSTTTTTTPTTTTPTTTTPTTTTPATTTPATTVSYPDGTLLKSAADPKVYVVKNGEKVWIQTASEFTKAGYKWTDVKTVSADVIKQVGAVTLLRAEGDPRVYVVKNNTKRHITSPAEFASAGYSWSDVQVVAKSQVDAYSETTTASAVPASTSTSSAAVIVKVVDASVLRVRAANTTASKVVDKVNRGETFAIIEEKNNWYKIKTKTGVTGWIFGAYAKK